MVLSEQMDSVEYCFWDEYFDDEIPDDAGEADEHAVEMLSGGEGNQFKGYASVLNYKDLQDEDKNDYNDEEVVVEHLCEDIVLIFFEFSGVKEVENLEEYEAIEEESGVNAFFGVPFLVLVH